MSRWGPKPGCIVCAARREEAQHGHAAYKPRGWKSYLRTGSQMKPKSLQPGRNHSCRAEGLCVVFDGQPKFLSIR